MPKKFANSLDRRMIIQRPVLIENSFGEEVQSWETYLTLWCSKMDVSDGERWRAGEVQATVTTRFKIRWGSSYSTITPIDRILFEGMIYEISHIKELDRRRGFEITASARGD